MPPPKTHLLSPKPLSHAGLVCFCRGFLPRVIKRTTPHYLRAVCHRRLALSVLPERTATLIVRVLEAFMALQYHSGVLTEDVALKVQSLVEVGAAVVHYVLLEYTT